MATLTIPTTTFTSGAKVLASEHSANMQAIQAWANGNINNTNFTDMAGPITWAVTSAVECLTIATSSTDNCMSVAQTGILASGKSVIGVSASGAQTTGDALLKLAMTNAGSSIPACLIDQDGTGAAFKAVTATGSSFLHDDGTNKLAEIDSAGVALMGAKQAGWRDNFGLKDGADTSIIKVQGASAALSVTNPMHITLPSATTVGLLSTFKVTADVSIEMTGTLWGFDGGGDLSDQELCLYAINDTEAIKWGVSDLDSLDTVTDTDASTTQANVNASGDMLVNSTLNSGTWPCILVGMFKANYTDVGDEWAIQTSSLDDIRHTANRVRTVKVDNTTIEDIPSTGLQIKDLGVSRGKLAALGQQISASSTNYTTTATISQYVETATGSGTDLSVTITTTGRPVLLAVISAGAGGSGTGLQIGCQHASQSVLKTFIDWDRGGSIIAMNEIVTQHTTLNNYSVHVPSNFIHIDLVGAGTHTYKMRAYSQGGTTYFQYAKLVAIEL